MIVCRRATKADAAACLALLQGSNVEATDIPDIVFICEDTEENRLLALVGIQMDHPGMVVVAGYTVQPDVYADPEMRRAVAEDFKTFFHGWLAQNGCKAYVCGVSKRNTRMQRWLERQGARRYAKKSGLLWYVVPTAPGALEEAA